MHPVEGRWGSPRRLFAGTLQPRQRNTFTLLRFLAATLVVIGHTPSMFGRPEHGLLGESYGAIAVGVFFVMSGYLVTSAYLRRSSLWQYARNRALRILPAYAAVVVLTVFVLGPLVTTAPLADYFHSDGTWAYLGNATFSTMRFDLPGVFATNPLPTTVNGSIWTLPIEVAMYLAVPLLALVGALERRRLVPVIVFVAAIDLFAEQRLLDAQVTILGVMPAAFVAKFGVYFLLGALGFLWTEILPLRADVGGGLWLLTWLLQGSMAGRAAFFVSLAYTVLFLARWPWAWAERFGEETDLSYGLYLYAFPVQQCVVLVGGPRMPIALHFLVSYATALACAALSWRWIERPALSLKRTAERSVREAARAAAGVG